MKCYFSSYCKAPRNLCCNFCNNKECDSRCRCNSSNCELFLNEKIPEEENYIYLSKKPLKQFIKSDEAVTTKTPDKGTPTKDSLKVSKKELFSVINNKQKLKLYKKYSSYYTLKENPLNYELVKTTKNRAQKKADELNKGLSKKYWTIEEVQQ